jgi:hypothetical protein
MNKTEFTRVPDRLGLEQAQQNMAFRKQLPSVILRTSTKKACFIFVFIFLICSGLKEDNGFDTYCNHKFRFCIDYPKDFIPQGESYILDGQVFLSKDSLTEIRAAGMYVMDDSETISEAFIVSATGIKVSYKVIKDNWFIFSGVDKNGKIVYEKTIKTKIHVDFDEDGDKVGVYQTLRITYPETQKDLYKIYCNKIAKSLQE